ncbi:MAG TPA: hypothetical protein VK590_06110 [Saprospiraceae bacterium]|nr:hypothetical protein [Saprospiraceae bacterium]
MISKPVRILILFIIGGLIWYGSFYIFFILSNAQGVLANPAYQSSKFLKVFMDYEPLPRMLKDSYLIYKGFYLIGTLSLIVFLYLNNRINTNWIKKAFSFSLIQWALMIPWFEFYLPYNVMHEPFNLVLLEAGLWYGVILLVSVVYSFILNFKPIY